MFPRLAVLLALAALQAACQRVSEADQRSAIECVRANLAAMEKGDVEAVAATIHPKSPAYGGAREQAQSIFDLYKLTYALEKAETSAVRSDSIHVHFVMTARKLEGPDAFVDNRTEGVHILRRDGEQWKIWETRVQQARDLEGKPLPTRAAQ